MRTRAGRAAGGARRHRSAGPRTRIAVTRRRTVKVLGYAVAFVVLYSTLSIGWFHYTHRADPFQQNVATWARNHHLGFAVNRLERWLHSDPPSTEPADELALRPAITLAPTTVTATVTPTTVPLPTTAPAVTAPSPTGATAPLTTAPSTTAEPPTSAPPTTLPDPTPLAIATVVAPALPGEGQWQPIAELRGAPVVWATSVRPLADYGSVVATAAVIDQSQLRAALFNGPEIPGKGTWNNYKRVMAAAVPSLVVAFNGGFRMEHFRGGYMTEGRTVRPLRESEATFAIRADGWATVGVYGDDVVDDGTWISLRQNLPPVVMGGAVSIDFFPGTYWGDDFHHVTFTYRSAVCTLADGRLMFVAMGKVDIDLLARALVVMGCRTAMELDINGDWPQFATYTGFGTNERSGVLLDTRMRNANRYLNQSDKDFVAFFDPVTLPPGVVS